MDTFEIQTDFFTNEFLELASIVEPGTLNEAVKGINAKQTTSEDMRPRATDKKGVSYLVDTGAAVSCYPVHKVRNPVLDPSVTLRAVNGSTIETYGKQTFRFKLGAMSFTHTLIIARIKQAVLSWDYIQKFHLDLKWRGEKCVLSKDNKSVPLKLAPVSSDLLGLAEVSDGACFKKWSEGHKSKDPAVVNAIPPLTSPYWRSSRGSTRRTSG